MAPAGNFFNDLFKLDTSNLTWSNLTVAMSGDAPEGASGHAFVTCGEQLYLVAGITKSGISSDHRSTHT